MDAIAKLEEKLVGKIRRVVESKQATLGNDSAVGLLPLRHSVLKCDVLAIQFSHTQSPSHIYKPPRMVPENASDLFLSLKHTFAYHFNGVAEVLRTHLAHSRGTEINCVLKVITEHMFVR
jgi:hypothetical protein